MSLWLKKFFNFLLNIEEEELVKVFFLAISFLLIIGAYTVCRELKDAVFTTIIGLDRTYLAYAKILSMFTLIPILFFHAKLVDLVKKHQLLYIYSLFFGLFGLLFAFFLNHPIIGLPNMLSSPYRIFGWLFYLFIEGYSPLLVSVFWAFANSITKPQSVKSNYTTIIAGSKIGGILFAGTAWIILHSHLWSDAKNLQILLAISSIFVLFVPLVIYYLVKNVPHKDMHGYEAAFKVEKVLDKQEKKEPWFISMLSGLILLFKYPYTLGIFGLTFFYELINQVLKIENIIFGKTASATTSELTGFFMWQALLVHLVGLLVVLFGTRALLQILGERRSLMLVPTLTGISIIIFIFNPSYVTAIIAFVITRSVNYALAVPLRESLYIPTIKEIRFKTKSWIDGMGSKFAKMTASSFNMYVDGLAPDLVLGSQTIFFSIATILWFITSFILGAKYEYSVKHNEVIGSPSTIN